MAEQLLRCRWVPLDDVLYRDYHDTEWGFPVADDTRLFEKLCLEGFQAGLSWRTILGKREAFRERFAGFAIDAVAALGPQDVAAMLDDARIVRHRGKITAAIGNAAIAADLQRERGSLAAYVWQYAADPGEPPQPERVTAPESDALSTDLKRRGWRFLGPTSAYAFAQSVGLVNDHESDCWVRGPAAVARARLALPA
jgi:DNA-3-methyladenine glycosylase I